MMFSLSVALSFLGAFLVFHIVRVERRLSHIPGPFVARFTDYWKLYHLLKGDYGETIYWWHQHYGDLIRIGPRGISVASAMEVPRVYQTSPLLRKGNMYKGLIGWYKGKDVAGLEGMVDETLHSNAKRVIASAYTWNSIAKYESRMNHSAEELIGNLQRHDVVDITEWLSWWGIDSMNNTAFSSTLGFMKNAEDVGGTLRTIRAVTGSVALVVAFPTVFMWFAWLISLIIGPSGKLVSMCLDRVEGRIKEKGEKNPIPSEAGGDLLDAFIMAREEKPDIFSYERVIGMTFTSIVAGSDTTAHNLSYTIYHLLKTPYCLRRLQEEIDQAVLQGALAYPPTLVELSKLPYLEFVVKEGLRLSMLLQLPMERIVPKGGMKICGQYVPEDMTVGCISRAVHLDKRVYGEDAEEFSPERWLEASEEKRKLMERCGIWFGSGKHTCIGQNFARANTLKVLAMMMMKFEISDLDPNAKMLSGTISSTRSPTHPYLVRLKNR